jgi:predicted amidohydrolase YtcJ
MDTLILGGIIHPLGGRPPVRAALVRDGVIVAVGTEAEARAAAYPGAEVVDLAGGMATPGITDSHMHVTAWAMARRRVDLHGVRSLAEVAARVAAADAGPGGWVIGQGWNRHLLDGVPAREVLDRVDAGRPVLLESNDIHAAWLNGEALRRCGITRATPDPPSGAIVRDAAGEPTGVLLESARVMAVSRVPPAGAREVAAALVDAQAELHRLGITGIHSVERSGIPDLRLLADPGELRLRVLQHVLLEDLEAAIEAGLRSGDPAPGCGPLVRIGGVKMFLDGALGSCTAWLREPYEGDPGNRGIRTLDPGDLERAVRRAAAAGLSSTVHAIGDAAVELALDVLGSVGPPGAVPHRIEHLQLCPPELWRRAARSGVVASMQPVHLLTDIPAAERQWGHERSRGAYAFAPLLRGGMTLAFGSDAPVEQPDPRAGLYAAVRRVTWAGDWQGGEWFPEHALTPAEALSAYTEGPAAAAGESGRLGRLGPGYAADLTVWDRDPLAASPDELLDMRCMATMVDGRIVFRAAPA